MANYNVDIELAVKGNQRVEQQLKKLEQLVVKIGSKAKNIDLGGQIRLKGEQKTLKEKIKDQAAWNKEQKKSVEIAKQLNQRTKGLGQFASPIGPKQDRTAEIRKQAQQQRLQLATKSAFQTKLELALAKRLVGVEGQITKQQQTQIKSQQSLNTQKEKALALTKREAAVAEKTAARNKQSRGRAIGGAASGAIISAAFPVLTGGSATESVLGGVGGLLGSALGPLGSFAGGIGGSALGRILNDAEELNKSLVALTAKFGDTGAAALFTAGDVSELAKQLNITKEDVVSLAGELGAFAQLSAIEDLAKAFGPIGGAGTFDALAQAAESEAAALKAIDGLRGQIGLKTAEELLKVLEIEGSEAAQAALLDALLDKTEDITTEVAKQVGFWDRVAAAIFTAASGEFIDPKDLAGERAADIVAPDQSVIDKALADYEAFLRRRKALDEKFNPKKERKGRAGGGGALPQSQELQLRQEILKTELAVNSIQGKRAALQFTDLEAVRAKELLLAASLVKETQILELARQQALTNSKFPADNVLINQLYDDRLKKIQSQNFLLREQNGLSEKNILLQQNLIALRNEQQTGGIVQGLERGIEDAHSLGSSEVLELRMKQLRRQEDLIGGINDKLAEQRLIEASGDAKKAEAATLEIGFLNNRKAAIEALLPALNQAEQQQLKFNQAFAAVTPVVNSLVGGISEVVAGTKTAEEAFADFLKSIGDMLIQAAQQMIATYIAIGIAKIFAGMGSKGGGNELNLGAIESYSGIGANTPMYAEGGFVTGPTNALIGEGGEPEYVLPASKMNEAMSRYSRGARGSAVIPMTGGQGDEGDGSTGTAVLDVRYTVERINNVDYVTAQEFQEGLSRATRQGAELGRRNVYSDLINKRSVRSRVGL